MKEIAIITGASSGIGRQFATTLSAFDPAGFDEVWVIARGLERLEALRDELPYPIRPLALDLSDPACLDALKDTLRAEAPQVSLLVNASGFGRFEATTETPADVLMNMVDLNCKALMATCLMTLPFMGQGAQIINIASVAAFQPIPYINVYAASKSFVLSFSRGLNRELKGRGIRVMAVCPFWTKTGFFDRAIDSDKPPVIKKYTAMYRPEQIVKRAWRDAKRGRDVSKFGFVARGQAMLCKLLPHSFVMSFWQKQQKLK